MHPYVTQTTAHELTFSPCNRATIQHSMARFGHCLVSAHCSVGGTCCAAATATAVARPRPRGTMCRSPRQPCEEPAECNGMTAHCPSHRQSVDGTLCILAPNTSAGVCQRGECVPFHAGYCSATGRTPCSDPDAPCTRACVANGICTVDPGIMLTLGHPCEGRNGLGVCDETGACLPAQFDLTKSIQSGVASHRRCAWTHHAQWTTCSKQCGGGTQTQLVSCQCTDGSVDESGLLCAARPPPDVVHGACNTHACEACETVSIATSNAHDAVVRGLYALLSTSPMREDEVCPSPCTRYYSGNSNLYLYPLTMQGHRVWVLGRYLGMRFGWVQYTQAPSTVLPLGSTSWISKLDSELVHTTIECQCDGGECKPTDPTLFTVPSAPPTFPHQVSFSTSTEQPMVYI